MKALIFYWLLEKFFIDLNQLIPPPNQSIFVVLTSRFLAIPVIIIITILYHVLVLKPILGIHDPFTRALFLKIWLPSFVEKVMRLDKKATRTPWDNRVHPKYKQDLDSFSMPKNHIYNSSLFGNITEFDFFQNFLAFWVVCPFFMSGQLPLLSCQQRWWLPCTMVKDLCNLFIHAHPYHNGPQPKDCIKHASDEANFDCGLKR